MRENKEITTIFDPRRTGTTGSGPSSSGGTRRPLPTPPSVVIVTAPPLDNPAPPVEPSSGEIIMPNGPSLAAPPPGSHCPQVLAPPSQSAIHPPQAVGAPVVQGTCNAQPVTDQSPPQPCPGNSRRASALQSLRNFRKSCCSRSARKMYCGVCVTVCVTASWVCATHSIKYLYHLGPTADPLRTSDAQVVEVVGGPASSPYASPSTSSSSSGIVSLGPSSSPGASSTRLIPATEVSPTYDAPFFTTWFCTNWTILFFPIYAIGRFLASPCSSRRGAANAGGEEGEEGAAQDSERATVTKKSRCCRCCCCCGCKSCCRRRRSEEGSGGPRGSPTATSVSSSSSSSSSEDEGNGGSQSSSSVQSSPERDEGRRERKRRRRRRRRRRRGRERDLEEGEEAEVSQSSPGMSSPSRSAVSSPRPPPTPTKQCCFCMCRKKKHHHHHHHHHHKRHHCCDLLGDTMQRFRDKGFTPARFLTRCSLFCLLWVGYNYMYVHSLRILFSTDAMALFATHACCVYLLSWVLLHHQFVGVRIVAVITCDTGIALLAYMDGITGSPTLGGVVLAAFAAAGSAVYKVLFKKVMGEASMGQVALFFSIVGLLNALLLWPLLLALYLLGAETFLWNDLPWLELLLAGGLSLLANLFSNFSVAVTYDLFITLGFITAVPVSAALDVVLYGAHFAGMKLAGIVLISVGFFLVMFPDNWPDYITRLLRNIILLSHSARWSRRQRHGGAVGQRRDVVDYRTGYIRSHLRSPSGRVR